MCQNLFATDWAMHVVDMLAKEQAPIKNPSPCSQLNSLSTKNIWFLTVVVLAQLNALAVHAQTVLGQFQNKIHQT
jgi:hypothetical protein